ncbi:MAG TPA: serine/threonine-protein kinase [Anaeromyxobacteraceae bacterium]|nr:serine/threonine-protein kinase [Anaeromyxobacteraceae bacterium]
MKDPIQFGRYRLLERLAVGGMAEVFLAREGSGGLVAVKRLLPTLAEEREFVDLFLEEARLGAALEHRGIVRVLEAGREETGWFMALEWVAGRDLAALQAQLAGRDERLAPALAAFVARQVCGALEHAHRRLGADGRPLGLVHQDVSPRNVLCSWEGAVKLADVGIARAGGRSGPAPGLRGKPRYLSPEQARGGPVGPRSDVFSLAAVLHELLTGRRFPAAAEAAPPSRSNPAVPPGLDAAVLGALARDPEARTPSAADLAGALEPFADPEGARSLARLLGELFPEARRRDLERAGPGGGRE